MKHRHTANLPYTLAWHPRFNQLHIEQQYELYTMQALVAIDHG